MSWEEGLDKLKHEYDVSLDEKVFELYRLMESSI